MLVMLGVSCLGRPVATPLRSPSTGFWSRCVPVGTYFEDVIPEVYMAIGTTVVLVFLVLRILRFESEHMCNSHGVLHVGSIGLQPDVGERCC